MERKKECIWQRILFLKKTNLLRENKRFESSIELSNNTVTILSDPLTGHCIPKD